jgi:hypothetical protein
MTFDVFGFKCDDRLQSTVVIPTTNDRAGAGQPRGLFSKWRNCLRSAMEDDACESFHKGLAGSGVAKHRSPDLLL